MTSVDLEGELRRVALITQYTGWTATALENEASLDLQRLFRGQPRDVRQRIQDERRRDGRGQVRRDR